jgi:ABC-type cobalamin/Fe3+-siderophores transport system ATPase subunit
MIQVNIPTIAGSHERVAFSIERPTFVVGPNGAGKSSLLHLLKRQMGTKAVWLTAHRSVIFRSHMSELTAYAREQNWTSIQSQDVQDRARYTDDQGTTKSQIILFDLIDAQRVADAQLADAYRQGRMDEAGRLAQIATPVLMLNGLFLSSNIPIKLSLVDKGAVVASKNGSDSYGINELSDGERSALIVAANIITAPPNAILLIDEPERHLHRSVVSPLITAALELRADCAFVVATHDLQLASDQQSAQVLLIRDYEKSSGRWDLQTLEDTAQIGEEILASILGSRRKVVFVEGGASSLDKQLYEILLRGVSVRPVRTCRDVESNTRSMRNLHDVHRVEAFGLVDADHRSATDIERLAASFVFALPTYSVESLYYSDQAVKEVYKFAKTIGHKISVSLEEIITECLDILNREKIRLVEKRATNLSRRAYMSKFPEVMKFEHDIDVAISIDVASLYRRELDDFQRLIAERDLNGLARRYAVRETTMTSMIASRLQFRSHQQYEGVVRHLAGQEGSLRNFFLDCLQPLIDAVRP